VFNFQLLSSACKTANRPDCVVYGILHDFGNDSWYSLFQVVLPDVIVPDAAF
jgi:hypothetical protein